MERLPEDARWITKEEYEKMPVGEAKRLVVLRQKPDRAEYLVIEAERLGTYLKKTVDELFDG